MELSRSKTFTLILILIATFFSTSCVSIVDAFSSNPKNIDDVINKIYSKDPHKDEIMRFLAFNGVYVRESSIDRISNWVRGARYEVPIQKGIGIVYFEGDELIAIRDKYNLNYIYGGPSYY